MPPHAKTVASSGCVRTANLSATSASSRAVRPRERRLHRRSSFRAASHHSPPNPMPRFSIILTVLLALAAPLASSAQSGAPVRAPAGCTYETCALRIEPRFFASARLLRGRTGEPVGSLGGFGSGVDTLLAGPDSAAAHARRYVTDARRAGTLGLIGAVAGIVAIVRANGNHEDD